MDTLFKFSQHVLIPIDNRQYIAWGCGCRGRIGNGLESHVFRPEVFNVDFDILKIRCGSAHTVFLDRFGKVYGAGLNIYGALGLGDEEDVVSPKIVPIDDVVDVSCGYHATYFVKRNGELYVCGRNQVGQLGTGTVDNIYLPMKINLEGVKKVFCGGFHSFAITENGDLYGWGNNEFGQLGLGHSKNAYTPSRVPLENVASVSCGDNFSLFLLKNGKVCSCGHNDNNELGLGEDIISVSVPHEIVELSNVTQIRCGSRHSLALTRNNRIFAWGNGARGQLGFGDVKGRSSPQLITSSVDFINIQCGDEFSVGVSMNGSIYTWGNHEMGGFGEEKVKFQTIPRLIAEIDTSNEFIFLPSQTIFTKIPQIFSVLPGDLELRTNFGIKKIHSLLLNIRCPELLKRIDYFEDKQEILFEIFHNSLLDDHIRMDTFLKRKRNENDQISLMIQAWKMSEDLVLTNLNFKIRHWIKDIRTIQNIIFIVEEALEFGLSDIVEHSNFLRKHVSALSQKIDESKNSLDIYKMISHSLESNFCNDFYEPLSTFTDDFSMLFVKRLYPDLSLFVEDCRGDTKVFEVHKLILSYSSGFFEMLIRRNEINNEHHTPLSITTFSKLIDYFYRVDNIKWTYEDSIQILLTQNIYLIDESQMQKFTNMITSIRNEDFLRTLLRQFKFEDLRYLTSMVELSGSLLLSMIEETFSSRMALNDVLSSSPHIQDIQDKLNSLEERSINDEAQINNLRDKMESIERTVLNLETKLDSILFHMVGKRKREEDPEETQRTPEKKPRFE
eukprot:TRINITY_DN1819_c0_g1_i2.p1 TRINITY_DN1819_c0_g1~~TRINITY_DN1819_c0_g1_i2.p1  ORF type:complete len:793 (+),score=163.19 TRINITY_DN1819_c0_g1_i2:29-2380(+)